MRLNPAYLDFLVAYVVNAAPVGEESLVWWQDGLRSISPETAFKTGPMLKVTFTDPAGVPLEVPRKKIESEFQMNLDTAVREVLEHCGEKGRVIISNAVPKEAVKKDKLIEYSFEGSSTGIGHFRSKPDGELDRHGDLKSSFGCGPIPK
ncbi:hypothetical protein BDP27DRAFT_1430605 [Rhodocollybia butyracea]|uniref:Uncharacterized protein n=1 Tax=Rhodocollybia butyracea TaxID=206335 RepID=A0A9P5PD56_9AGAR|nr:hypothetical protein BDP27DRAFT_1430605 [Rhodocollybia butyracea]